MVCPTETCSSQSATAGFRINYWYAAVVMWNLILILKVLNS